MALETVSAKVGPVAPLLLPLIGSMAEGQQPFNFVSEIASHITRRVEQQVRVSVGPAISCDHQTCDFSTFPERHAETLSAWLHQGVRRLLLVPLCVVTESLNDRYVREGCYA